MTECFTALGLADPDNLAMLAAEKWTREDVDSLLFLSLMSNVARGNTIPVEGGQSRLETDAEHTWSSLLLAFYFGEKIGLSHDPRNNIGEILELLLYHDLPEVGAGDVRLNDQKSEADRRQKQLNEARAVQQLVETLTSPWREKLLYVFQHFEGRVLREPCPKPEDFAARYSQDALVVPVETTGTKFAKAIDKIDGTLQESGASQKPDWRGWGGDDPKRFLWQSKLKYLQPFPALLEFFQQLVENMDREGFFDQG